MGNACCSTKSPNTLDFGPKTTKNQRKKAKRDKNNRNSVPASAMNLDNKNGNSRKGSIIVNEINLEN